jgi:pimeloyl-ACP methyl ester carboxylesterase
MSYPSLLLVHGAANGAWVWDAWRNALKPLGWQVNVLDLKGHGRSLPVDMTTVTMEDYAADLESVAGQIEAHYGRRPVIGGWSMGGLVAMMHAAKHPETPALLLFAPSPPLEVQGKASLNDLRGVTLSPYGPELYGIHPDDAQASTEALADLTDAEAARVREMSRGAEESGLARRQRKSGLSIPAGAVISPTLVIYGDQDTMIRPEHSRGTAQYLQADAMFVPRLGHWGLVANEASVARIAPAVDGWLRKVLHDDDA